MKRYDLLPGISRLMVVVGGPLLFLTLMGFLSLSNLSLPLLIVVSLAITVPLVIFLWFGFSRGTYIVIDRQSNLYNVFLFIRRDVVPLSTLVSLKTQHPLLLSGKITRIWKTYRNKEGKLVTKTLTNRQFLSESDFKDLIETIRRANPAVQISEELLS